MRLYAPPSILRITLSGRLLSLKLRAQSFNPRCQVVSRLNNAGWLSYGDSTTASLPEVALIAQAKYCSATRA
jgi:hypothetical protein